MNGRRETTQTIRSRKMGSGGGGPARLVCLTAYDCPTARLVDEGGADVILVGDSMGNVVLGYESTLPVTLEDVLHHTRAVTRARPRALVVADMPWLTYQINVEEAVRNAGRLIQEGGADAVKLEGGLERVEAIRAMVRAQIPVMGHLGLTPQSILEFGGYKVQGRDPAAADRMIVAARAIEAAGCFSMVLEGIPASLAGRITAAVAIPTIGIGAGAGTDGQVLVIHDLLGYGQDKPPRFVRRYADLSATIVDAVRRFAADVRSGSFPADEETYRE